MEKRCGNCERWRKDSGIELTKFLAADNVFCRAKMGWCGKIATMSGDYCNKWEEKENV